MKNYWISIDMSSKKKGYQTKQEREIVEETEHKLMNLLGFEKDENMFILNISDEEKMQDALIEAAWITDRYLREVLGNERYSSFISMYTKPYCKQCGQIGENNDDFCSKCGVKLIPKQDYEFTKIKICS